MSSIAKRLIIAHYINSDFDLACDDLLQILKTTNDKELRLSILKYFQVFEFSDAMDILVNYMGNEEWEYRALAARALGNHESIESIGLLYDGLKDSNWHVRTNSARSLIKLVASSVLFNYIQDTDDKYARDTMIYALFESGKLTYDEFQYFIAEGVVLS
jgi:HEAT repeat protein